MAAGEYRSLPGTAHVLRRSLDDFAFGDLAHDDDCISPDPLVQAPQASTAEAAGAEGAASLYWKRSAAWPSNLTASGFCGSMHCSGQRWKHFMHFR